MSVWLAVLVVHSLLLVALLLGRGRRVDRANVTLAVLVASVALLLTEAWLGWSGTAWRYPHLFGVFRPIWFTVGPLCYLYIRRFLGFGFARWELVLPLPALAVLVVMMPFYLRSAPAKLTAVPYLGDLALLSLFLGFSLLTAGCSMASARVIARAEARRDPATVDRAWRSGWLRLLMWALAAYALLDFIATVFFTLRGSLPDIVGVASLMILVTLIYATGYLVVLPDGLLARAASTIRGTARYRHSEIAPGRAEHLVKRLDRLMTEDRPWLDEQLRLDDLAQRLRVSRHHLSQLLNQYLDTTFHAYVNRRRAAEAQRLLLDPGWDGNVLTVGLAAGFGSSASFYRVFRKYVGVTPKAFVAQRRHPHPRAPKMGTVDGARLRARG